MERIIGALLGAEWILIFKTWVAPGTLFLLFCMAGLRLMLYLALPNFMGGSVVFFVAGAFLIWHLKAAFKGETRHYLDLYHVPEKGIPRLVTVARHLKFAEFMELGIVVAILLLYMGNTPLYWPNVEYSPDTKQWLFENARLIAILFAGLPFFGLALWNHEPKAKDKKKPETEYTPVRPQAHNMSGLGSVNELMKQHEVDNRGF